jgi:hypothetical protein
MLTPEWIGVLIVLLTQIVVFVGSYYSLLIRVRILEQNAEKAKDTHEIMIAVKSKIDLLYDLYKEQHNLNS